MNKLNRTLLVLVFVVASLLRLGLALVNRESNDSHLFPVRFIMLTGKLPHANNGGESYQPKLYHYAVASAARVLGISPDDKNGLVLCGQGINFAAGMIVLAGLWWLVSRLPLRNEKVRLGAFALSAFNPALVGINGQATNDTFVILFSTVALCGVYVFMHNRRLAPLGIACLSASLAAVSKTNGWPTTIAILLALAVLGLAEKARLRNWAIALGFPLAVVVLSYINPLSQYDYNLQHSGSPVLSNLEQAPPPGLFATKDPPSGEISSIQEGFFTFRLFDLLKMPYIAYGSNGLPSGPTSFWTLLYARANSIHFDLWPPSWTQIDALVSTLLRLIFLLALVPTALVAVGAYAHVAALASGLLRRRADELVRIDFGLWVLTFLGYIAFLALYTYQYRSIAVVKAIFALPALLALLVLFSEGADRAFAYLPRLHPLLVTALEVDLGLLVLLYIAEIADLIFNLARTPNPFA